MPFEARHMGMTDQVGYLAERCFLAERLTHAPADLLAGIENRDEHAIPIGRGDGVKAI
jgi:hypothetical protein